MSKLLGSLKGTGVVEIENTSKRIHVLIVGASASAHVGVAKVHSHTCFSCWHCLGFFFLICFWFCYCLFGRHLGRKLKARVQAWMFFVSLVTGVKAYVRQSLAQRRHSCLDFLRSDNCLETLKVFLNNLILFFSLGRRLF